MGCGFTCFCTKCDYSIQVSLGAGMVEDSINIEETQKMREGQYGEQGRRFLELYPEGAITTNMVVARCKSCGNLMNVYDFNLQIPEPKLEQAKVNLRNAIERGAPRALKLSRDQVKRMLDMTDYITKEEYIHICDKCGKTAYIVEDFEKKAQRKEIECPKCKEKLSTKRYYLWD